MKKDHAAHGQYHLWMGSEDHYSDDEIERLEAVHGEAPWAIGVCEGCGEMVHVGAKGYNEQVHSYVRYGPFFICSKCILSVVDLPEIDATEPWHEQEYTDD